MTFVEMCDVWGEKKNRDETGNWGQSWRKFGEENLVKKNVGLKVKHNLKLVKKVEKRMLENVQKRKYLETMMITMDHATCDNKII